LLCVVGVVGRNPRAFRASHAMPKFRDANQIGLERVRVFHGGLIPDAIFPFVKFSELLTQELLTWEDFTKFPILCLGAKSLWASSRLTSDQTFPFYSACRPHGNQTCWSSATVLHNPRTGRKGLRFFTSSNCQSNPRTFGTDKGLGIEPGCFGGISSRSLSPMANILSKDTQIAIIGALAEGSSAHYS
jgi:hypothetical protein